MHWIDPNFWQNLKSRPSGPLAARFILQPIAAAFVAIRAGLRDSRGGKRAYLYEVLKNREERRALVRAGWHDIATVFMLAIAIDFVYQVVEFRWFYPGESILIGICLAIVPYAMFRGPTNRVIKRLGRKRGPEGGAAKVTRLSDRPSRSA